MALTRPWLDFVHSMPHFSLSCFLESFFKIISLQVFALNLISGENSCKIKKKKMEWRVANKNSDFLLCFLKQGGSSNPEHRYPWWQPAEQRHGCWLRWGNLAALVQPHLHPRSSSASALETGECYTQDNTCVESFRGSRIWPGKRDQALHDEKKIGGEPRRWYRHTDIPQRHGGFRSRPLQ